MRVRTFVVFELFVHCGNQYVHLCSTAAERYAVHIVLVVGLVVIPVGAQLLAKCYPG